MKLARRAYTARWLVSVRIDPPQALVALVDRITAARVAVDNAGSLDHRRARVAAEHLEFEIVPYLDQLNLQRVTDEIVELALAEDNRQNGRAVSVVGLVTGRRCPPHERFDVSAPPAGPSGTKRVFRIEIPDQIATWFVIHEITIGGVIQYPKPDGRRNVRRMPLPGSTFAASSRIPRPITFDVVGGDIIIIAEYIGPNPDGEIFQATAHWLHRDADAGVKNDPLPRRGR